MSLLLFSALGARFVKKLEMVCCLRLRFCVDGGDDCDELSVILPRGSRCGLLSQLFNTKRDQERRGVWHRKCRSGDDSSDFF